MSHIHVPDGVLPSSLWISGWIVAILLWMILLRIRKGKNMPRQLPLLGMMAAAMVLGASVEILPIAYHVNLTVISGILLGPSLIFMATFIVNVILALFGHGGVTVIGLNTLILSTEGILGYFFFRVLWKVLKRLTAATFLATFLALAISTFAMIGVVGLGVPHYEELIHQEKGSGILDFKLLRQRAGHHETDETEVPPKEIDLKRFVAVVLPLGCVGWILEGVITCLIIRYIHRLRPELLGLEHKPS